MKLVFICEAVFPENKGGLERWFESLTKNIAHEGDVVVYLNASGVNEVRGGVNYVSITPDNWHYLPGGVRSIRQSIEFALRVFSYLRINHYDGVYCAQAPILTIFSVTLIKIFKKRETVVEWFEIWPIKYWIRYRGFVVGTIGWAIQFLASQFGDQITVFTPRAKNALRKLRFGRSRNILILDGLVNMKDELLCDESQRTDIVFLGRLVKEKQPELAIEAVKLYLRSGWNGQFWLIGQGPLGNHLKNSIRDSEFSRNINVIQDASDEFVRSKLRSSFLLIHPSRREGYGLSIVEAANQGVPTLLIDYSDNAAVDLKINPDLVSKSDSPQDLAGFIHYAFQNQEKLRNDSQEWMRVASVNQTMIKSAKRVKNYFHTSKNRR